MVSSSRGFVEAGSTLRRPAEDNRRSSPKLRGFSHQVFLVASNDVFISYRRDMAGILALSLHQNLTQRGIDAFYDIEDIKAGQFDSIILGQIEARPYFIVILTPGTLERCAKPQDWVRREIEHAVACDRIIIPTVTPKFDFDDIDRFLPTAVAGELRRFSGQELPQRWFKYAVDELAEQYLLPVDVVVAEPPPQEQAEVHRIQAKVRTQPPVLQESLTAQEYFERAYARNEQGDLVGAIADYDEAIRLDPTLAPAFINRGLARNEQGDRVGAIADYDEAIRLDPTYAPAFYNRGVPRHEQGDRVGAIADYEAGQALGTAPELNFDARLHELRHND